MEKPSLVTIVSKISLRYSYRKLGWPKASTMSYEVLYIAKGGVALDIPLCDSSYTLMTLHLLYDCYIQLSTLELPLDKTLHYNAHVPMWDKMAWASHARHHWHLVHRGETNSLTCFWCQSWSSVMVCMRSMVTSCWSEILPPLHWYGSSIQLVC